MYDNSAEALRLDNPFALNAAVALEALSRSTARAASSLRASAARTSASLAAERPRDRLGPRARVTVSHPMHDGWRIR